MDEIQKAYHYGKMKSKYGDIFNHDNDAKSYDESVTNEDDPIRAGYSDLLVWMAGIVSKYNKPKILELGSGTGNLTKLLSGYSSVTSVDLSEKMMEIARAKLPDSENISFVKSDILEVFDTLSSKFDIVLSSYAIHHLTDSEKEILFGNCKNILTLDGIMVFGDLMFENESTKDLLFDSFRENKQEALIREISEEFSWDVEKTETILRMLGFDVHSQQFSQLSWGIVASRNH